MFLSSTSPAAAFPWSTLIIVAALVVLEIVAMLAFKQSYLAFVCREFVHMLVGSIEEITGDKGRAQLCGALVLTLLLGSVTAIMYMAHAAFAHSGIRDIAAGAAVLVILFTFSVAAHQVNRRFVVGR